MLAWTNVHFDGSQCAFITGLRPGQARGNINAFPQITFIHWRNGPSHLGNRFAPLPKRVQSGAAAHSFGNLAQSGFKPAQAGHFVSDLRYYAALTALMSLPALTSPHGTARVRSHRALLSTERRRVGKGCVSSSRYRGGPIT